MRWELKARNRFHKIRIVELFSEYLDIKRFELKYTITESLAQEIRDYIKNYFSLDKYVAPGKDGYIVNSLYFDTPDFRFYYDTKNRKVTRYKPRARYYGVKAKDFIWTEIKFRNYSAVWKNRRKISIATWNELTSPQESEQKKPILKQGLDSFEEMIYWYDAHPAIHVRYFREPYVTDLENYGRVTFDRNLAYRNIDRNMDLAYNEEDMIYYDDPVTSRHYESPVILEIKVETLVPFWAINIIKKFELMQRPFSKYCYGIDNNADYFYISRDSVF